MRFLRSLIAVLVLLALALPAGAVPQYYKVFKTEYVDKHPDQKFAEAMNKADVKCLVCHQGKKRTNRNALGQELSKLLDHKKDAKDEKKISESLKKVLAIKLDPKSEKSETYLDRLNAGKWPGGELKDLKAEPKDNKDEKVVAKSQ
jgi:hypothetical protein